jgi:hypothetical protein
MRFTTTSQSKHQMERGLLLNVVVGQSATVFELLACKDQTLLIRGDRSLLVFLLRLDRTLTRIILTRESFSSDILAIVEPEPYPIITDVGSQWRIAQSLIFLPLGTAINRGLLSPFGDWMVIRALRGFPPPDCLADFSTSTSSFQVCY